MGWTPPGWGVVPGPGVVKPIPEPARWKDDRIGTIRQDWYYKAGLVL